MGLDFKMNYMKFAKAHLYLASNPDLPYLATNIDPTLPSTKYSFPGKIYVNSRYSFSTRSHAFLLLCLGAGALIAMLNASVKNRTPTVLGKPTKVAYETLKQW